MAWTPAGLGVIFVLGLFLIAFGQSGLDKITDYAGNREWLTGHFGSSPFKGMVGILLPVITLLELGSAAMCGVGAFMLVTGSGADMAKWAMALCGLTLLCLFAGQRFAKDYAGAMTLAVYGAVLAIGFVALNAVGTTG